MAWPRKHRIIHPLEDKELELKSGEKVKYPQGICIYCGEIFGLEEWKLRRMPVGMAICFNDNAPKMKFKERLLGTVDCMSL